MRSALAAAPPFVALRRERITVRRHKLGERDWTLLRAFVGRLTPEDVRRRFGAPLALDDEATLRRAFEVEAGAGEIAWLADEEAAIAGIVQRVMVSPSEAELGLIVRPDRHRAGIGEFLLRDLQQRAARQGLKTLCATVLRDNRAMLRLALKLGYVPRQESAWMVELALALEAIAAARSGDERDEPWD